MSFRRPAGPRAMIIVTGHLVVDPADRDAYLADCAEVVRAARATDGCLEFALSADLVDPARVLVLERWRTRAALEAFRRDGPDDATRARIVSADVAEHEVED